MLNRARIVIAFMLLLTISLTACSAPTASTPPHFTPTAPLIIPTATSGPAAVVTLISEDATQPAAASTPTAAALPAEGMSTYIDSHAGIAFDYPADWTVNSVSEEIKTNSVIYSTSFTSPETIRGPKGSVENLTKFDLGVYNQGPDTPENAAIVFKEQILDSGSRIVEETQWMLPGDIPATRLLVREQMGDAMIVVTAINGRMVVLGGVGDFAKLEPIAKTLRAAP